MADQTAEGFVPPAAKGLPAGTLEAAEIGANRLDAWARTPNGRNFLAHALVQLARTGWLRTEPGEGFEPMTDPQTTAEPEPAGQSPATDLAAVPTVWIVGHPQLEAIAAAVWEQCGRSDSGMCVEDDPRNIAVAALGDVLPAPTDRASVLRDFLFRLEQSAGDAAAEKLLDDNPDLAALLADAQPATAAAQPRAVAYRSPGTRTLYCVICARQETGWQPVTELRDDTVCDFCGGRVAAVASQTLAGVITRHMTSSEPAAGAQQPKEV